MNIYMIRQHLNQIERLRVRQPNALQTQEDINEAIEFQKKCISEELEADEQKPKSDLIDFVVNADLRESTEASKKRFINQR